MHHLRAVLTGTVLAGSLALATGAPAGAKVVETFPLDFSASGQSEDFCLEDLTVDFTYDQTGRAWVHQRPDGLFYFQGVSSAVQTFTYEGRTLTNYMRTLEKDLEVVDNGDGTWSVTVLLTGPHRTVNEEGRVIAKDDGQIRVVLLIDPETGDLFDEELIFGSTGTNDDFCAAALDDWGL